MCVNPVAIFGLVDWYIEDFCWVNNHVVSFKVIPESRWEAPDSLRYSYFKANLGSYEYSKKTPVETTSVYESVSEPVVLQ